MITLVRSGTGYLDVAIIRIPERATTRDEADQMITDIPPGVKYIQLDMSRSIVLTGSYIDGLVKGILETLDKDIKAFYLTSVKRDKEEIAKLRRMVDSQRAELTRVNSQLQQKVNKINEVLLVFSNLSSAYENRLAGFFAKSISDFLQTLPDTPLNMSEL